MYICIYVYMYIYIWIYIYYMIMSLFDSSYLFSLFHFGTTLVIPSRRARAMKSAYSVNVMVLSPS